MTDTPADRAQGDLALAERDAAAGGIRSAFEVRVAGFEGPFDLLLALIARRRIEVTALALHEVTDDFVAHIRAQGSQWDLDETTSFLVIAATLMDLKAARLLPDGSVEDEEDVALLEARDILFARLLQYRAFKEVAALIAVMIEAAALRRARDVAMEPWLAALLPEVQLGLTPEQFAELAASAFAPKPGPPTVATDHVHAPPVSVPEQVAILSGKLRRGGLVSFRALILDASSPLVVVARFLALLELYRDKCVSFQQPQPLGELLVRWVGEESEPSTEPEGDS